MTPETARDYITSVAFKLYALFPEDSDASRILPDAKQPSEETANVLTRLGSPADRPRVSVSSTTSNLAWQISSLGLESITIPTYVAEDNIQAKPNQLQTGMEAPSNFTGKVWSMLPSRAQFSPDNVSSPLMQRGAAACALADLDCRAVPGV